MWSCLGYHVHWKCLQLLFMAGAIFHFCIRHPTSLSALTKICQCTFMTPPVHSLSLLCRNSPVISPQSFILFSPISPHLPLFLLPCEMKSFHHLLTYRQHHMVYRWINIQYNERGVLVKKKPLSSLLSLLCSINHCVFHMSKWFCNTQQSHRLIDCDFVPSNTTQLKGSVDKACQYGAIWQVNVLVVHVHRPILLVPTRCDSQTLRHVLYS